MTRPVHALAALAVALLIPTAAAASPTEALAPEPDPAVLELQRAAIRYAGLQPERLRRLESRMRVAGLAPVVRVRIGRGLGVLSSTTDYDGASRLTVGDRDAWQFDVSAGWSLDRLVWSPDELRLHREEERSAQQRERLISDVTRLYYERRRLETALARGRAPEGAEADEARLRIAELTAILDGLTGGALRAITDRRTEDPRDRGRHR